MQVVEAHGARIPTIGLGTMTLKDDVCVQAVKDGAADRLSPSRHRRLLWQRERERRRLAPVGRQARGRVHLHQGTPRRSDAGCIREGASIRASPICKLPYVDLLLIHWNNPDVPFKLSVGALCKAKKEGKTKHIGVANFTTAMLDEAWAVTSEPLVCNQIEMHPFINQDKVVAACKKHGMAVVAYCPIARGKVPGADALERIGKAHGKSAAQVSLRYLVQMGVCSIPRTATPEHLKQNIDVFDFKLSDAEMAELKKLNATNMRVVNPPHAPKWDAP